MGYFRHFIRSDKPCLLIVACSVFIYHNKGCIWIYFCHFIIFLFVPSIFVRLYPPFLSYLDYLNVFSINYCGFYSLYLYR